jgi:hypothetical protein
MAENGAYQGPPAQSKPVTLDSLAEMNRYDRIGKMLDTYRKSLDLDDYDSEHGNAFRDAAKIVRALCEMRGVPLKYESKISHEEVLRRFPHLAPNLSK